jgi:2-polyprenyl-3-methyl-5-hydroxy-6-metoxy-1,4-benzoquinol methylase
MPSPDGIFQALTGYQRTRCLKAAIDLELFTAIAEGFTNATTLGTRCKTSPRGMRILCDYLVVLGFLTKTSGEYGLSPESAAFLNQHSPAYMGSVANFLASDQLIGGYDDIAASVRKGGTALDQSAVDADNDVWVEFARSMAPMMRMPAAMIAGILAPEGSGAMDVLDIAAGHGVFGITIANQNPKTKVVAVDWKNVLELAQANANAEGVGDRYTVKPGSAFDVDLGGPYHLILLTNFLHHFGTGTIETFLKKIKAALKPGGRVATLEFVPNDDRVSPPFQAAFSMMMLGSTPNGDAYTFAELEKMFANAGFGSTVRHDLLPTAQTLLVSTV